MDQNDQNITQTGSSAQTSAIEKPLRETMDKVKQDARDITQSAQDKARSVADERKEQIAGALGDVSQALHQGAASFKDKNHDLMQRYADKAAEQVDQFGRLLRERDLNYFIRRAEDFARRRPALFIGGAMALGFVCVRFLRSSSGAARPSEGPYSSMTGAWETTERQNQPESESPVSGSPMQSIQGEAI